MWDCKGCRKGYRKRCLPLKRVKRDLPDLKTTSRLKTQNPLIQNTVIIYLNLCINQKPKNLKTKEVLYIYGGFQTKESP